MIRSNIQVGKNPYQMGRMFQGVSFVRLEGSKCMDYSKQIQGGALPMIDSLNVLEVGYRTTSTDCLHRQGSRWMKDTKKHKVGTRLVIQPKREEERDVSCCSFLFFNYI